MPLMADWFRDAFLKAKTQKPQTIGDMLSPGEMEEIWEKGRKLGRDACKVILDGVEPVKADGEGTMQAAIVLFLAVSRVRWWVENSLKSQSPDSPLLKVWDLCEAAFVSGDDEACLKAMDEVAKSWKKGETVQ